MRCLLLLALPGGLVVPVAAPALAPVRPRAVVRVEIGSRLYRTKLDGDGTRCGSACTALEAALSVEARAIFDSRFRFVDWRDGTERTADTVIVRLREKPIGGHIEIVVTLLGRSRAISADSVVTQFDDFFEAKARDASYWTPVRLRRVWADLIAARLDASATRVIQVVVGKLPLGASVNLPGIDSSSRIDVSADSLRAAAQPPITFLVRVNIEEVVQGVTLRRLGELKLVDCLEGDANRKKRYVCRKLEFAVLSPARAVMDFFALSSRSRITKESVHVYFYASSAAVVSSGGIVAAGEDP